MSLIGFVCSVSANSIILKYLWSRPPMQQTLAQPLCMVQVTVFMSITCKETLIVLLGNCFPDFFQSLFYDYPLWLCGFFNNRINSVSLLYSLMVLGISKLILLIKPMLYHTADHERLVRYALLTLAGILSVDTVVYLLFSNPYYCHEDTMLRIASLYNKSTNFSLLKQQQVGRIHTALDHSQFASLIVLEISLNVYVFVKYKRKKLLKQIQWLNMRCITGFSNQVAVDEVEMVDMAKQGGAQPKMGTTETVQTNRTSAASRNRPNPLNNNLTTTAQDQGNSSEMSNKNTIAMIILIYIMVLLHRNNVYGAVFLHNTYSRFLEYGLSVVWLIRNEHMTKYVKSQYNQWKQRRINQTIVL